MFSFQDAIFRFTFRSIHSVKFIGTMTEFFIHPDTRKIIVNINDEIIMIIHVKSYIKINKKKNEFRTFYT